MLSGLSLGQLLQLPLHRFGSSDNGPGFPDQQFGLREKLSKAFTFLGMHDPLHIRSNGGISKYDANSNVGVGFVVCSTRRSDRVLMRRCTFTASVWDAPPLGWLAIPPRLWSMSGNCTQLSASSSTSTSRSQGVTLSALQTAPSVFR